MADGKFKFTSDAEAVKRDLLDLARKVSRLEAENTKLKSAADGQSRAFRASKAEQQTMLQQGVAGVRQLAAGYLSVASAVTVATKALEFMRGEQEKAAASLEKMQPSRGRLNQVANDASDLTNLQRRADDASGRYGFTREASATAVFSARSENFERALDDVFRFSAAGADLEQVSKVAGQLPTLFAGAIDAQQAIAGTFVASRASRLDFAEIGSTLPIVAEGAKGTGTDAAQSLALASVLASQFASGATSADRIKAFGSAVAMSDDERIKGQGIVGATQALINMNEADRKAFLGGSMEVNAAFKALAQELPTILERQNMIAAELAKTRGGFGAGSEAAAFIARADSNVSISGVMAERAAKNRAEIANERWIGTEAIARNVATSEQMARLKEEGRSGSAQFGAYAAQKTAESLNLDAGAASRAQGIGAEAGALLIESPLKSVPAFLGQLFGDNPFGQEQIRRADAMAAQPVPAPQRLPEPVATAMPPAAPTDEQLAARVAERQAARAGDAARNLPGIAERARQRQAAADAVQPAARKPTSPPPQPAALDPMADVQQRIDRNLADLGRQLGQPVQPAAPHPVARPERRPLDRVQADIDRNLRDLGRQLGEPVQPAAPQPAARAERRPLDRIQADIDRNLRDLGRQLGQPLQTAKPAAAAAQPRTMEQAERAVQESMENMRRTFNQPAAENRVSFAPPQQSRRSEDLLAQIAGDMRTVAAAASQSGVGGQGSLPAFRDRNVRPGVSSALAIEPA